MRPVGAAIPIGRVAIIALDPVEIGVDPSAGLVVLRLRQAVRFIPFALGFMPKRPQSGVQSVWRLVLAERVLKFLNIHRGFFPHGARVGCEFIPIRAGALIEN